MIFAAKLLLFFQINKHKSPKYLPILQKRAKKGNYSATEMPNTGHRGQMSAEPMSELNSDVMDEERSGMVCRTMNATESPIVSGIKEERKSQPT